MSIEKLSPEERHRIFLEEKARMEIRDKLEKERPKKQGVGTKIGIVLLVIVGVLIILVAFGSALEERDTARFHALTPEQQHAQTLDNCASLLKEQEYKLYSELSVEERKIRASCAAERTK